MTNFTQRLSLTLCCIFVTLAASADVYYAKGDKVTDTNLADGKYFIEVTWKGQGPGLLWYRATDTSNIWARGNIRVHSTYSSYYGDISSNYVWTVKNNSDGTFTLENACYSGCYIPAASQSTWYKAAANCSLVAISNSNGNFYLKTTIADGATDADGTSMTAGSMCMHADAGDGMTSTEGGIAPSFWGIYADGSDANYGTGSYSACAINVYKAVADWQYSVGSGYSKTG